MPHKSPTADWFDGVSIKKPEVQAPAAFSFNRNTRQELLAFVHQVVQGRNASFEVLQTFPTGFIFAFSLDGNRHPGPVAPTGQELVQELVNRLRHDFPRAGPLELIEPGG